MFADLDLRQARGLETVHHASPSTVGADTLARSMGMIPEGFLRGCGLAVWEILAARQYDTSLSPAQIEDLEQRTLQARTRARLPRRRVLISYSAMDAPFVDELRRRLLERGLYSWVAAHEDKGAVRERQSKLAIDHDLTLLLVLSQSSVQSDWVEHEMRLARKLEKATGDDVFCPVSPRRRLEDLAFPDPDHRQDPRGRSGVLRGVERPGEDGRGPLAAARGHHSNTEIAGSRGIE